MATRRDIDRQRRADAEGKYWRDHFSGKLQACNSWDEAVALAHTGPGPGAVGRGFHSNLAFFLQEFRVPNGATASERGLYAELIRRLDEAGVLRAGVREAVERALADCPAWP